MALKTDFRLTRPDDCEVTLTATMTLSEWRCIKDELSGRKIPSLTFIGALGNLIDHAEKHFHRYDDIPKGEDE